MDIPWTALSATMITPWIALLLVVSRWAVLLRPVRNHAHAVDPEGPSPLPQTAQDASTVVIVAARNEAERIGPCLEALREQAHDALEILVVDDFSEDDTAERVRRAMHHDARLRLIRMEDVSEADGSQERNGKARALSTGIRSSQADIILTTDADCRPPPDWARSMSRCLAHPRGVDALGGVTYLEPPDRMSLQAMDWRFFFTLIAGVSPQGRALTMMGNNMGFRREVYDRAGGFEAVAGSVTEDHALLARMHRDPSTRSALSLEGRFKNVSLPEDSLWKAFVQRRRWARGAVRDRPLEVLPGLLALWIVHALVASILVVDPLVAVLLIWSFALVDLAVMHQGARLAGEVVRLGLWSVLRFELYLIGYTLLLPVSLLLRWKLVWKGRVYG